MAKPLFWRAKENHAKRALTTRRKPALGQSSQRGPGRSDV